MNLITIFPLISAVVVFFLGMLVFFRDRKNMINITFFFFSLASTVWMFGTFMMFFSYGDIDKIIFWDKFVYIGVVYIPVTMLHFGLAITKFKIIKNRFYLYLGYALSTFFLSLLPTKLFIDDAFIYKWGAHSKAQLLHHFFLLYFVIYIILWFVVVVRYYKQQSSFMERERIKYCFVAFLILATIGPLAYLPAYGVGIYPFAYVSGLLFTIIISYSIIRYRFMDIKLVLRKSSVYIISLTIIFGLSSGAKYLAGRYLVEFSFWMDLLVIFFAVMTFPYIKERFSRFANQYFFTSLYDSQKLILKASNGLKTVLEVEKVYDFLRVIFSKNLHTKAFGILLYDKDKGVYELNYNKGFRVKNGTVFQKNPVVEKNFIKENKIVMTEELENDYYSDKTKELVGVLDKLKVDLLVPLKVKDNLIGLLAFGEKETQEVYNDEDLEVIEIIAGQAAISIENGQLYSEVQKFNINLKKEVKEAVKEAENINLDLSKTNRKLTSAYKKLKQLDSAKNEFISIASHQLRTPLTSIKGFISLIMDGDYGKVDKEVSVALKKISISNERLIKLVNDLLSLSRIESGKFSFHFSENDVVDMTKTIIYSFKLELENSNLKLKFIKPRKKIEQFCFDRDKMHEVISNLIDNAIKYTQKGKIEVSLQDFSDKVRITIADSGKGMEKEEVRYVFEKFRRGMESTAWNTEGVGLGLYVCKKIVDAHDGEIYAKSEGPGKGSQFVVELKKDLKLT